MTSDIASRAISTTIAWAGRFTERRSTNALAVLAGGPRRLPLGQLQVDFTHGRFPWPVTDFQSFVLAQQYLVRGLSVRNRQCGLGTPLDGGG